MPLTKSLTHLLVLGVMLLRISFSMGQDKPVVIRLKVFHDGQEKPVPDQITLHFNKQTLKIPIKKGAFEVSPQFLAETEVGIGVDIDRSHIDTAVPKESFVNVFSWEISIADKQYGKDVEYAVPKGADIRKSCIMVVVPLDRDGWWMFDPRCRSKRK
jgi:hypothetical protein